jgi:hypothetical protein
MWWKPFQMSVIAVTVAVTYRQGLHNPWAGGMLGFCLAWLLTHVASMLIDWRTYG